jgi:hypothetical protein
MRNRTQFLVAAICGVLPCITVSAEIESPKNTEAGLIAGPPTALAGTDELHLVIVPPRSEPNLNRPLWKNLDSTVRVRLIKAGVKITPLAYPAGGKHAEKLHNTPELKVQVEMLRLSESQQYVFTTWLSLASEVSLVKQPQHRIMADVWKVSPTIMIVPEQEMPERITNVVMQQIEMFTEAFLAANPPGKRAPDPPKADSTNSANKPVAVGYLFVASKNSKVFHRPNCRSANRISTENLVGYASREQALAAGKQPCKLCKP